MLITKQDSAIIDKPTPIKGILKEKDLISRSLAEIEWKITEEGINELEDFVFYE